MKILLTILIGIAVFLGARYMVTAIQTERAVNKIHTAAQSPTAEPIITPERARAEFMRGCDTGEYYLQNEYCQCMWTQMVSSFGVNTIVNDGLQLNQVEMETKYARQIDYCLTTTYKNIEL
jgi:hypothetical protein